MEYNQKDLFGTVKLKIEVYDFFLTGSSTSPKIIKKQTVIKPANVELFNADASLTFH